MIRVNWVKSTQTLWENTNYDYRKFDQPTTRIEGIHTWSLSAWPVSHHWLKLLNGNEIPKFHHASCLYICLNFIVARRWSLALISDKVFSHLPAPKIQDTPRQPSRKGPSVYKPISRSHLVAHGKQINKAWQLTNSTKKQLNNSCAL